MSTPTESPRVSQFGDVVQINAEATNPTEIVGCLGYVVECSDPTQHTIRVYQPKTVGENAEYSEYTLPVNCFTFVGTVPSDMQPIL